MFFLWIVLNKMATNRIIVLIDMDCFYVQVEERDHPQIKGQPAAVVQYNKWKGGGIIAVNYEARAKGVKRSMRGDEARNVCPNIHLITVPEQRGKANLTKYRNAGSEVIEVLCQFSDAVERASIDEAYIDFTKAVNELPEDSKDAISLKDYPSTWVEGYSYKTEKESLKDGRDEGVSLFLNSLKDDLCSAEGDYKLALVAATCERMRKTVLQTTGFKCSAGISHNKMLSKLACGLHKPNQQTILPMTSVPGLWNDFPLCKVRNLGGKLGASLSSLFNITTMGQLSELSIPQLSSKFDEKTVNWLFNLGRGIDNETVTARLLAKSIGCGKNFPGQEALNTKEKVVSWMNNLTEELSERLRDDLTKNNRLAKNLTVHIRQEDGNSLSRSSYLHSYDAKAIAKLALNLIQHTNSAQSKVLLDKWQPAISNISLSAGKFVKSETASGNIKDLFKNSPAIVKRFSPVKKSKKPNLIKSFFQTQNKEPTCSKSLFDLSVKEPIRKSFDLSIVSKFQNAKEIPVVIDKSVLNIASDQDIFEVSTDEDEDLSKDCPEDVDVDSIRQSEDLANDQSPPTSPIMTKKINRPHNSFFANYMARKNKEDNEIEEKCNSSPNKAEKECPESILNRASVTVEAPKAENTSSNCFEESTIDDTDSFVDIHELFPDLSCVSAATVALLPLELQIRVKNAVQVYNDTHGLSITDQNDQISLIDHENDQWISCEKCRKKVKSMDAIEHADYHFAVDLRHKQMDEFRSSLVTTKETSPLKSKSSKRGRTKSSSKLDLAKVPKIDSFFHKK